MVWFRNRERALCLNFCFDGSMRICALLSACLKFRARAGELVDSVRFLSLGGSAFPSLASLFQCDNLDKTAGAILGKGRKYKRISFDVLACANEMSGRASDVCTNIKGRKYLFFLLSVLFF